MKRILILLLVSVAAYAQHGGGPWNPAPGITDGTTYTLSTGITLDCSTAGCTALTISDGKLVITGNGSYGANYGLYFGDGDTGFYESGDDTLRLQMGGGVSMQIATTSMAMADTMRSYITFDSAAILFSETVSDTNPVIVPDYNDLDTGIGWAAADTLSAIAGGVEAIRMDGTGGGDDYLTVTPGSGDWGSVVVGTAGNANVSLSLQPVGGGKIIVGGKLEMSSNPIYSTYIYSKSSVNAADNVFFGYSQTSGTGPYIAFEGATQDAYEIDITSQDPTADHTLTLPAWTGTFLAATESAGAPTGTDCDADVEKYRTVIDTTNHRLYICRGATRGWDYVALTD